jgi:signal transduction histidine kinase
MEERASLLIVDDERGPSESMRMIFKPDYNVFTASCGQEALEILHSQTIDVVTLDMRMPGMHGSEVMEHIKRFDSDIEIIVVTGYASLDSALRGLRHRVFDYITKPFDVPQICDLVRRAVAHRRAALSSRRLKDDFLANLSHELRTPLSAIIGYNSILVEELQPRLSEDQRSAFDRIQANSQRLLSLIETVLLLNSLDAGELELSIGSFDARETLRRAVLHFSPAARRAGIQLAFEGDVAPLWVHTDAHKFERILWALVDNAIKFTRQGSIALHADPAGDGHLFETVVRDTGIGLRSTELNELMAGTAEPTAPGHDRGLGLGLRMAARLCAFLGGSLRASSSQEAGTCFVISLPVYRMGAEKSSQPNA